MRHVTAIAACLLALLVPAASVMAQEEDAQQQIERPPSEAELRESLGPLFDALLAAWRENKVDYAHDSPREIARKQRIINEAIRQIRDATFKGWYDPAAVALNYVMMRNMASPALSGRVLRVADDVNANYRDLDTALANALPGDLILLGEGEYHYERSATVRDIAIVGMGRDRTTLLMQHLGRYSGDVRIEGVYFDCQNDCVVDYRSGETLHLRDCLISNYNSGAGGSNCISVSDGYVLIERCTFDGSPGRAQGRERFGNVFRWWGNDHLFVRHTQFLNNNEIHRASGFSVFDGCVAMNPESQYHISALSGDPFVRDSSSLFTDDRQRSRSFELATDDLRFVERARGRDVKIDPFSAQIADLLKLDRNLEYWIGLIRHDDERIRAAATQQVERLAGDLVEIPERDELIQHDPGSLRDLGPLFKAEVAYGTLMQWHERNALLLRFDEERGAYRLDEAKIVEINPEPTGYDSAELAARAFVQTAQQAEWADWLNTLSPDTREEVAWDMWQVTEVVMRGVHGVRAAEVIERHGIAREALREAFVESRERGSTTELDALRGSIKDRFAFAADMFDVFIRPRGSEIAAASFVTSLRSLDEGRIEAVVSIDGHDHGIVLESQNGRWFVLHGGRRHEELFSLLRFMYQVR